MCARVGKCVRVYVCACVRTCVRARARLFVCVCGGGVRERACLLACVFVGVFVLNRSHERTALSVAWDLIPGHLLAFCTPSSHVILKNDISQINECELFLPSKHLFKPFCFLWVFERHRNRTYERSKKVPGRYMYGTLKFLG